MKNLAKFFIENPKLTVVFSLFLLLFGWQGLSTMNAESYPSVDFATAIIETEYFGATPEDIEVKITKPIEDELRGISGLKDVRSTSQAGRSKIVVRVDMDNPKVVVKDVMGDIQRAIDRTKDLPTDLQDKPKFTEIKSEEFAAMEIAVIGPNLNRQRDIIADALKEDIEDDKNVKSVNLDGYREREFEINLSRQKLDQYHIGVDEVLRKIGARNSNIPGGELETSSTQRMVKVDAKIKTAQELGMTPIRSTFSGGVLYLKDVATVKDGEEEPRVLTRYMGEPATLLTVLKKGGSDTLKLVGGVNPTIKRYEETYKDKARFVIYFNEGQNVEAKLSTLSGNAISGLIVVISVLMFFMHGRLGIMVAISLPVILLATLGLMPYFDMTLNSITILALIIAMGMLVDNSIVIAEEYIRRRQLGSSSLDAAVETIETMWIPISATAFTTIAAFLPMLVTTGIMGRFIAPIPIVVTAALLFCLFECFLLLPMRLHVSSRNLDVKGVEDKKSGWFDKVSAIFSRFMAWTIDHRYITAAGVFGIIVFSFVMIGVFNKFMLFPPDQTEIYLARVEMPEDTKVERTYEVTQELEEKIKAALGKEYLKHSVSLAGTSLPDATDVRGQNGDNVGLVKMYATDFAKFNVPHTEFLAKLRKIKIEGATNLTFEEQINGPPVGAPVTVIFRSNNGKSLDELIGKILADLKNTKGVFDAKVDEVYGPPEVSVVLDFEKLDRLGLTAAAVGNTVRTALSGTFVSDVTLNNKEAELKVKFGDVSKSSVADLGNVKIMDARGNLVPLSLLAKLETSRGTPQVKRYDFKRAKTVTANIEPEVITSVLANAVVSDSFARYTQAHPDVTMVFGGEQESTNESMASLGNAMILALVGIYAIMVYIFRSYLAPGLIMTTIPLGLLGVSVAFWAHGRPVSFLAMIGVIGLAGIIVNNGIILIDFINQMRSEGKMPLREILIQAPTIRLKPVMATSLTTMGGLFPTAYGIGGADAMLVPMTLAMAWGLTTGTILTLVWIPAGYAIIEDLMKLVARLPLIGRFTGSNANQPGLQGAAE
ncbi:efflux RND transporter permease subunit [Peredibacter starrii]|uniref:Efflux RND transporter permease subunit n=1 Tax=Peredibacter starrii TaxID=28202 RepID=A0AAX4HLY7_9BACT|nr:efflux RND transporter permease subunit [Peredibacter starrii]WPU63939.1 efflux RND transporter permease subunit [Peredibacter starrii]